MNPVIKFFREIYNREAIGKEHEVLLEEKGYSYRHETLDLGNRPNFTDNGTHRLILEDVGNYFRIRVEDDSKPYTKKDIAPLDLIIQTREEAVRRVLG